MKISILYQDDDIVVVDKPAGLPTHAAEAHDPYAGDALRIVQGQLGLAYLGMHQRLDADTSGVLLFSARREANPPLAAAFEGRAVHKVYMALVQGWPRKPAGSITAPLTRDRGGRYRVTTAGDPRGQTAHTNYRVVRTYGAAQSGAALLEIVPETGRTHQIRVHLAHLGHPVVGDPLYGPPGPAAPRLFLHAQQLTLPHPATGQALTFTAPLPSVFVRMDNVRRFRLPAAIETHIRDAVLRAPEAVQELLQLALERRAPLAADASTTIYRLVNGTGDGLPGLTVDRAGAALIASIYDDDDRIPPLAAPSALIEALAAACKPAAIYVKYRPRHASRVAENQMALLAPAQPVYDDGEAAEAVGSEEGLQYRIRPGEGLSTGLFADMREGRARVRAWSAGKTVLNCFAYTCGFGVAALAGGAARVLNLDLSKGVLAWGQENYRLNGFAPEVRDFVFGDVFDWLARFARRGERFDLIILDPPGFSRTRTRRFAVAQDYGELLALAARVAAPQAQILACSNVAEQPWRALREQLINGAAEAGRRLIVEGVYHEPAIDFPTSGEHYLKLALLRLD